MSIKKYDVCVVGGAGHVGAPLAVVLASRGFKTVIYDINKKSTDLLASGKMPFLEDGGEKLLQEVLQGDNLHFANSSECIKDVSSIIVTIGTPIDEFHNPVFSLITKCLDDLLPYLSDDQTIILRSTVAPGTTEFLKNYLISKNKIMGIAFCPERVVQGKAIEEIQALPQIVSGTSKQAVEAATVLFQGIAPAIVEAEVQEAEFAKLICNAYRYIEFAATNQLFMLVESAGVNYNKLLGIMKEGYPRMASIPGPGFAAGPCLMKDTMQLAALADEKFILGQSAMLINEGLPNFLVRRLEKEGSLVGKKVGLLGMAFKADSDDIRDSLSYKLLKILRFHGAEVSCSDEFVKDDRFISKEDILENSEVVIIGVPHTAYKGIVIPEETKIVDVWNII